MAAVRRLVYLEHLRRGIRRERVFRDRYNPLDHYDDLELFQRFRFARRELILILDEFVGHLHYLATRKGSVPAYMQIMIALHFYASGTFQVVIADIFGVSKATVHNCVRRVSDAIAGEVANNINFSNETDTNVTKRKFYAMAGLPNVIGCIDCTHVRIIAPTQNEFEFVNRKGYHSINLQLICDADLMILNCVVKWPGSVHDARILRESSIFPAFEANPPLRDGWLLGDGGYMLKPWLLTPYLNPNNQSRQNYNFSHSSTRSTIERCNGILKRRWHSLHGELRYSPENACKIIMACIILHNKAVLMKVPDITDDDCDDHCNHEDHHNINRGNDNDIDEETNEIQNLNGKMQRDILVEQYFSM